MAKEAVRALTRTAAREWAADRITVNNAAVGANVGEHADVPPPTNPLGRFGTPDDDIARLSCSRQRGRAVPDGLQPHAGRRLDHRQRTLNAARHIALLRHTAHASRPYAARITRCRHGIARHVIPYDRRPHILSRRVAIDASPSIHPLDTRSALSLTAHISMQVIWHTTRRFRSPLTPVAGLHHACSTALAEARPRPYHRPFKPHRGSSSTANPDRSWPSTMRTRSVSPRRSPSS